MAFQIPEGLSDLLQDFTVSVLREAPCDLVLFASTYFNNLLDSRNKSKSLVKKGISFGSAGSEDEQMQTDDSDEPMEEPPKNRFNLARRKSVAAERYDPEADEDAEKVIHPKSDEQRHRLNEAVRNILLFRSLDSEQMHEVIDAMFERSVQPGEHVIDQGHDGDNFYVIDGGSYDIYVLASDNKETKVGSYESSGSFGELALMYNMPRAATIVATSPGTLWAMDRVTFRRIVLKNAFNKRKMYEQLLECVPMLKHLEPYERMNVADALVTQTFESDDKIIRQGDTADCMYFVEDGCVRIMIRQREEDDEVFVNSIEKGSYFGELALVTHNPRAASAYAVGRTKCAVLDIQAFERLLGPCKKLMQRNIEDYESQLVQIFGEKANISDLR